MRNLILGIFTAALAQSPAFAVDVAPTKALDLNNIPIPNNTVTRPTGNGRIRLTLSCYATNLRGTANPLAQESTVLSYFDWVDQSGNPQTIVVSFEALMANAKGSAPPQDAPIHNTAAVYPQVSVTGYGNVIEIDFPGLRTATVALDGSVPATGDPKGLKALRAVRFDQLGAPGGQYVGHDGPLSAAVSWTTSPDGRTFDVKAAFPGAAFVGQGAVYLGETRTGFCGGYYSPLMLFFNDQRPKFTGKSEFKLSPVSKKIYWVEKDAPGYFLAIDKNGNGTIDSGEELFGDARELNGFKALEKYDDNKDGVINAKDKVFKKLLLWRDKNGDGIAQKDEIVSLSSLGVTEISLTVSNTASSFGQRAKYDRVSTFKFKRGGKTQQGTVLDILFSDATKE